MTTKLFKPAEGSVKSRKRKGRGNASGLGGECGRGHKGQKSRSGFKSRPGFEGGQTPLYRRLPKKPGMSKFFKTHFEIVNLTDINSRFNEGDTVDAKALVEAGLVRANEFIKVLGNGTLEKKVTVVANKFSKSAVEAIEKAGGSVVTPGSNE
jgi:large subunit ribosomal protein L15